MSPHGHRHSAARSDASSGPLLAATGLRARPLNARPVWQALKLVVAALIAYAIWRGYQNPDLVLDLAAMRLC